MNERLRFVMRAEDGEPMAALCREFDISRELGYRLLRRFRAEGPQGLYDRSRAPKRQAARTPPEIEAHVLAAREKYTWGARKLRKVLMKQHPGISWPCVSTIHAILRRNGLTKPPRRRRRVPEDRSSWQAPRAPNELWCADFKGEFRLGNGRYCYPLTITDSYSRCLLACVALESTATVPAMTVFRETFQTYGLPSAIRTDNGCPFAARGLAGLSALSASWVALGIRHQRIKPGKPQQNGRHERMHRTLKKEATRPPGRNILQQQERLDAFRIRFNEVRPHESLNDDTPSEHYRPSSRPFVEPGDLCYPLYDVTCRVCVNGAIALPRTVHKARKHIHISRALAGHRLGLREELDGTWIVDFADLRLGSLDLENRRFQPQTLNDATYVAPEQAPEGGASGRVVDPNPTP